EQTIVEQRAGLLPVAEHHHRERTIFGSGGRDSCGVIKIFHKVVLEEPVARLAQLGLAALFINLQMKLSLLVRGFCCHDCSSPFSFCLMNLTTLSFEFRFLRVSSLRSLSKGGLPFNCRFLMTSAHRLLH